MHRINEYELLINYCSTLSSFEDNVSFVKESRLDYVTSVNLKQGILDIYSKPDTNPILYTLYWRQIAKIAKYNQDYLNVIETVNNYLE